MLMQETLTLARSLFGEVTTCKGGQSKKKKAKAMAATKSASKYTLEYLYFL